MKRRSSLMIMIPAGFAMLLAGCANQQPREWWGRCSVGGAALGALVGAGPGYAVGNAVKGSDGGTSREVAGAVAGAGIGALIGFVAGHYVCDPVIQPPAPPLPPLPPPPPPAPAPPPPVRQKLVLRGVHFDFNKYNIRPGDAAVLDEAVPVLKANPKVAVQVNGYCDAIGGEAYNLRLSDKRAAAVAAYLEQQEIPASQLIPQGFGKTDFVAPNETADGRAQNRRVELVPED
jgi:OOP family OmpA-OmpF porin